MSLKDKEILAVKLTEKCSNLHVHQQKTFDHLIGYLINSYSPFAFHILANKECDISELILTARCTVQYCINKYPKDNLLTFLITKGTQA